MREPVECARCVGKLIRDAREDRSLTLEQLAAEAGISVTSLSMVERARRAITFGMAEKIFAAMGLRLHMETQPMWEDIDTAIMEMAGSPLSARIGAWKIEFTSFVSWFAGTEYMADGLMAAALQGAPVPVDAFEILVADDDDSLDELIFLLNQMRARRWVQKWRDWDGSFVDPRDTEGGPARYQCIHGEFRIRLTRTLSPSVWVEVDDLPTPAVPPISLLRKIPVLTQAKIATVPLAEIEAGDGYARRVLQRVRSQGRVTGGRRL